MTLIYADLTIDLPHVTSKKGRRALLNGIKEHLKRMNCSVLDMSGEYPKEARLALAFLSPNSGEATAKIEALEQIIQSRWPELETDLSYEIL
ncbi:MAG: DUF503 domain-containing protein [Epsilonproteobacteria bacterium]|nr:DUF503 domain-containing protein [Campylobacterota bacterium]